MSKKTIEEKCAYCGIDGKMTRDHVVPRCLFPTPMPGVPVIVPACKDCNVAKSKNDDFLRDLLTSDIYGQNNATAKEIFDKKVLKSAARNSSAVARTVLAEASLQPFYSHGGIELGKAISAPMDEDRLKDTMFTICKGLFYDARKDRIPDDYITEVIRYHPREFGQVYQSFADSLHLQGPKEIGDIFRASYVSAEEDPRSSVWLLQFYGVIGISVSIMRPDFEALVREQIGTTKLKGWGSK